MEYDIFHVVFVSSIVASGGSALDVVGELASPGSPQPLYPQLIFKSFLRQLRLARPNVEMPLTQPFTPGFTQ